MNDGNYQCLLGANYCVNFTQGISFNLWDDLMEEALFVSSTSFNTAEARLRGEDFAQSHGEQKTELELSPGRLTSKSVQGKECPRLTFAQSLRTGVK